MPFFSNRAVVRGLRWLGQPKPVQTYLLAMSTLSVAVGLRRAGLGKVLKSEKPEGDIKKLHRAPLTYVLRNPIEFLWGLTFEEGVFRAGLLGVLPAVVKRIKAGPVLNASQAILCGLLHLRNPVASVAGLANISAGGFLYGRLFLATLGPDGLAVIPALWRCVAVHAFFDLTVMGAAEFWPSGPGYSLMPTSDRPS